MRLADSQLAAILTIAADAIISLDDSLRITLFNDGASAIFGYESREVLGKPLNLLIPERFHSRHHEHVEAFKVSDIASRKMGDRQEIYARRKDGSEFAAEASIAKQQIDGRTSYMVVLRDATERNMFQRELANANSMLEARVAQRTRDLEEEIRQRQEAQSALIRAQRMEAFGQLTGGIAHDFNNLLTIISGNLELFREDPSSDNAETFIKRALDAAEMGTSLTKRLLLFARQRRLAPQVLNVNELVLGLAELMKRSLGENISFKTKLAPDLWVTRADPSEIENAIINLAVNARDAMPHGGTVLVETQNIPFGHSVVGLGPSDHVLIEVSDTGTGMAPEVLSRAIEPFFTTKDPGKGTGLGLSSVYGFARQSGGLAAIESEPGRGTSVRIYLPRVDEELLQQANEAISEVPMSENGETVLVVEDNDDVRELTLQRVEGLGYVAIEAENAVAAKAIIDTQDDIALVLSDIVMPGGVSGYDLAAWISENHPNIAVVLSTGFAAQELKPSGMELTDVAVLRKPYSRLELGLALQSALNG